MATTPVVVHGDHQSHHRQRQPPSFGRRASECRSRSRLPAELARPGKLFLRVPTDSASAHEERGLKHRPAQETRRVPIPPELVGSLATMSRPLAWPPMAG